MDEVFASELDNNGEKSRSQTPKNTNHEENNVNLKSTSESSVDSGNVKDIIEKEPVVSAPQTEKLDVLSGVQPNKIDNKESKNAASPPVFGEPSSHDAVVESDDTKLKQNDNGTLISQGGEFSADDVVENHPNDSLKELQTSSDIRFFICGSCKNNPILIGSTPKLLPCLHSFCENCLKKRYEMQKKAAEGNDSIPRMKCPSCGQEFLVAGNDKPTSGFLNNQFVIESTQTPGAASSESEIHQCTSCDDKSTANSYCMNCNEWLCKVCVSAHQRVKMTKDHVIQSSASDLSPSSGSQNAQSKEKPLFCKIHPHEQLRLFCANCDKLTCRDCQLVEHKDHRYQFIEEAASKHREILKKLLQYLQINLGLLKETIVEVEKVNSGLSDQEANVEAQINKSFDSLISSIRTRQENVIKDLHNVISNKQTLLAKQKKDLTQMRIILEHNHDFAEFAVKGGSNVALLYSRKVLGTRLHNLNSLKYRQRPLAYTDLKFSMDVEKLCSYFNKIGAVYSQEEMQRKLDHYNTKPQQQAQNPTAARNIVPSRSYNNKQSTSNPLESMNAINKRISESSSNNNTNTYINLSKQSALGLPVQRNQQRSNNSPSNAYNINAYRATNQDMIVLANTSQHNTTSSSSNNTNMYSRGGANIKTTPTYEKAHTIGYSSNNRTPHYVQQNGKSPQPNSTTQWADRATHKNNNTNLDYLKKMVETNIQPADKLVVPLSGRSSNPIPNTLVHKNVVQTTLHTANNTQNTTLPSENSLKQVKQEQCSPEDSFMNGKEDSRCESGFDESQNNEDYCGVCRNGGQLLCCDTCPKVYHLQCHLPALNDLPRDSWSCGVCLQIETPQLPTTNTNGQRRRALELSERDIKICQKLLLKLFVHPDSTPFQHKVSKAQAPGYYKVITKPMDLHTVLTKLNPQHFQHYKNMEEFILDIRLIFANCYSYNPRETEVWKMGNNLEKAFNGMLQKHAPHVQHYPEQQTLEASSEKRRRIDANQDA